MRKAIWCAILIGCLTLSAWAGDEGGADYAFPFTAGAVLDDSAGNNPLATVSVVELTGADLVALGAETAADALDFAAGCFTYHGDRWPQRGETLLRVRSSRPEGLQVLVDGAPIDHSLFGTTDLKAIPADQISRIRIYPGPAPVVFGPEGGAGVVEIVTRKAADKITANFDAHFGDHRKNLYSFGIGDTYQALQFFASASHHSAAGEPLPAGYRRTRNEEGGVRDGSEYARDHYRARIGAVLGEAAEAHFTFFYDVANRDVPFDVVSPLDGVSRFPKQDRLGGILSLRLNALGPFHLDGEAYLLDANETRDDYTDLHYTDLLFTRRLRDSRAGGGLTPWIDLGPASRFSLRLTGRRDDIEFYIQDQPRTKFKVQRYGIALVDDLNPLPWLNASFGGGIGVLDPLRSDTFPATDSQSAWHGRAGLAFGPFNGVTVRADAGSNPQFPTIEELFDANWGDPQLKPATLQNYEAAVAWKTVGDLKVEAIVFVQHQGGAIGLIDRPAGDNLVFANAGQWHSRGATLTAGARPVQGLYLGANATYQSVYDEELKKNVRLLYLPQFIGSFDARFRFPFGLGAAMQVSGAGQRRDVVAGQRFDMKAYALTNARLFYSYRNWVEVYLQGSNLLDVPYETKRFYPEPGRVWTGGLKLTY